MKDEKSLFTRIIEGEVPSFKIFENEHVYSFLDINPASYGHTLVVPKEPASSLHELSDESAAELGKALARISRSILEVTGVTNYNVIQNNGSEAGQTVFHVHFHIIPRYSDSNHELTWPTGHLDNEDALELAHKISKSII